MTDEPSVQRERAITPVLMSNSNAPAALTQSFGGRIDLSQSHGDAVMHWNESGNRKREYSAANKAFDSAAQSISIAIGCCRTPPNEVGAETGVWIGGKIPPLRF